MNAAITSFRPSVSDIKKPCPSSCRFTGGNSHALNPKELNLPFRSLFFHQHHGMPVGTPNEQPFRETQRSVG